MQNLWTMMMVALMGVICGSVQSYSAWSSPSTCPLADIRTQDHFDAERFSGMWYLISDYDTEGQFLYGFLEIADVRAHFSVSDAGSMSILTGARVQSSWSIFGYKFSHCFSGTTLTCTPEDRNPTKFHISYDTPGDFGAAARVERPYWLIATDYQYALFYGCFEESSDGTCKPNKTFAWTLNRNREGHTAAQVAALDEETRRVCLGPYSNFDDVDTSEQC